MALQYIMGDFATGRVTRWDLPLHKGTDKAEITIHGGMIEFEIDFDSMPASFRNNWRGEIVPYQTQVSLVDTDKPWDHPSAVLFSGFVDKVNSPIGRGFIRVQVADCNEYLAGLNAVLLYNGEIIDEKDDAESAEEEGPKWTSDSWANLLRLIAAYAFGKRSDFVAPAGAPSPPSIIRNGLDGVPSTGSITKPKEVSGSKSFHTLLEEIRDEDSPSGMEWRFVPVWADASMTHVKFDFITGTDAQPQIKANIGVAIELSENSAHKISSYASTFDGKEYYNKVYLKYEIPTTDGTTGNLKLRAFWNPGSTGIVVSKFVNASVPLTDAQAASLAAAYLEDGETGGTDISFTVEEEWDKSEWHQNVGKTVAFTGVPDTISSGQSLTVRCVGVTLSKQKGTVEATFMPIQTLYPSLPKANAKKKAFAPAIKDISKDFRRVLSPDGRKVLYELPTGPGSGTPSLPTVPLDPYNPGWSNDGEELAFSDLWGDEGRKPTDLTGPSSYDKYPDPIFADWKQGSTVYTEFDGDYPIQPASVVSNEGNRLYGLDHVEQGASTRYNEEGTPELFGGGLNRVTGQPLIGWKPFYIKKTYMSGGTIGPIETVGQISSEKIESLLGDYETHADYDVVGCTYTRGVGVTLWTVAGRLYAAIGDNWRHYLPDYSKFKTGGKVSVISIGIDPNTGTLVGDWQNEMGFPNTGMPVNGYITKYGKNVIFTGFRSCDDNIITDIPLPDSFLHAWVLKDESEDDSEWANYARQRWADTGWAPFHPLLSNGFGLTNETAEQWQGLPEDGYDDTGGLVRLGNLVKNYGNPSSEFQPFLGFMQETIRHTNSIPVSGFITNGYLYGASQFYDVSVELTRSVLARIPLTTSGSISPDARWEEIYSDEHDKYTDLRASTGFLPAHPTAVLAGVLNTYFIIVDQDTVFDETGHSVSTAGGGRTGLTAFKIKMGSNELKRIKGEPFDEFFYPMKFDGSPKLQESVNLSFNTYPLATGIQGFRYAYTSKTFSYDSRIYRLHLTLADGGGYRFGYRSMKMLAAGETAASTSTGTFEPID